MFSQEKTKGKKFQQPDADLLKGKKKKAKKRLPRGFNFGNMNHNFF